MPGGGRAAHERSEAVAAAALDRIRTHGLSADPQSFAVWMSAETGDNGRLIEALGKTAATGKLTQDDIETLHDHHLGPLNPAGQIDDLAKGAQADVSDVLSLVEVAQGIALRYGLRLQAAGSAFAGSPERAEVEAAARALLRATKEMAANNAALRKRFEAVAREISDLRGALETVRRECRTDSLTSLGNRAYFDRVLAEAVAAGRARREPVALLLVDLDRFREVNAAYGQPAGDRVLQFVALAIQRNIDEQDMAARFGGEEFAIILPGTGIKGAVRVAQQIRTAILHKDLLKHLVGAKRVPLTVSLGVASTAGAANPQALVETAEFCLLAAKRGGRNRVVGEGDEELLDYLAAGTAG